MENIPQEFREEERIWLNTTNVMILKRFRRFVTLSVRTSSVSLLWMQSDGAQEDVEQSCEVAGWIPAVWQSKQLFPPQVGG